jgi:hypothetical protein
MAKDRNRTGYKLTARGETVVMVLEGLAYAVTAWAGFWLLWAGLNVLVGN